MSSRKRIVVVDDDAKIRQLFEHVLQPPEFEAHVFSTGTEALRHLPEIRPDCVVSDIIMPGMDGETLLRSARDLPGLERLPFIIISALRSEGRIRSVLDAGATSFLQKPFPLRQLVDKLRSLPDAEEAAPATGPASTVIPFPAVVLPTPGPTLHSAAVLAPPSPAYTAPSPVYAPRAVATPAPLLQRQAEAGTPRGSGQRAELPVPATVHGFGRFTQVECGQRSFLVLTEHATRPRFMVTTVISEDGVTLRKIESSLLMLQLGREEDRAAIREQVDFQHEESLARISSLVEVGAPRRALWPDHRRSIDPALLAWTVSAVARRAEAQLGQEATVRLLLMTRGRAGADALRSLDVTRFGRVVVDLTQGTRVPRPAVQAVARWCSAFAAEAFSAGADGAAAAIREATQPRASELEALSFYDKLA